jgi:hypothetical protein
MGSRAAVQRKSHHQDEVSRRVILALLEQGGLTLTDLALMPRRKDITFPVKPKRPVYNETAHTSMGSMDWNDIYVATSTWSQSLEEEEYQQAQQEYSECFYSSVVHRVLAFLES